MFTAENFPVVVLIALPWMALVVLLPIVLKTRSGSLIDDTVRSSFGTVFLALSALSWCVLHLQPELPAGLYWFYPPLSLPQSLMTGACAAIAWKAWKRHPQNKRLLWLAGSSLVECFLLFLSLMVGGIAMAVLFALYAAFAVLMVLWSWYAVFLTVEDGEK